MLGYPRNLGWVAVQRRWLVVVGLSLLVAAAGAPAGAHFRSHADPDDPDDPDIARAILRIHTVEDERHVAGKTVFFPHLNGMVENTDLYVRFDSRGANRTDFYALMADEEGYIYAGLYRRGGDPVSGIHPRVSFDPESGIRIFRFRFPKTLLNADKHIRWRVEAAGFDWGDEEVNVDLAPDAGWFEH